MAFAHTENQRNALHIAMTNRMTPAELRQMSIWFGARSGNLDQPSVKSESSRLRWRIRVRRLVFNHVNLENERIHRARRAIRPILNTTQARHTRNWLLEQNTVCELTGSPEVQPFVRSRMARGLFFYSNMHASTTKSLVVTFAPYTQRPSMPVPAFLQLFDAANTDVALLVTSRARGYLGGVLGVGDDFVSTCTNLRTVLNTSEYARVVTLGTSAGALPSIIAGYALDADATLASGAVTVDAGLVGLLEEALSKAHREPRITLLFSHEHTRDRSAAHQLESLCGGTRIMELPGKQHNCLYELLKEGRLRSVVHDALGLPAA